MYVEGLRGGGGEVAAPDRGACEVFLARGDHVLPWVYHGYHEKSPMEHSG